MEHLFVSLDIALLAKQHGFNDECCTYFLNGRLQRLDGFGITNDLFDDDDSRIAAPIYQQVIDWLKAKHYFIIRLGLSGDNYEIIRYGNYEKLYEGIDNMDIAIRETFNLIK